MLVHNNVIKVLKYVFHKTTIRIQNHKAFKRLFTLLNVTGAQQIQLILTFRRNIPTNPFVVTETHLSHNDKSSF